MNKDLIPYYSERAKEYEKVYQNPAEQEDLQTVETIFQDLFTNKTVLEIACESNIVGRSRIANTATTILATDINESVIEIAKQRQKENIAFAVADIFDLPSEDKFDGVFGVIFCWKTLKICRQSLT